MNAPADIRLVLSLAASPGASGYRMHNAGYKALGLDYLYLPRKYDGDIAAALTAIRTLGIRGASLTMPFKQSCIPHLDALSETARAIGAVNTVLNDNGVLTGHNTDAPAAQALIEAHLPWQQHPLLILGAGGMAYAFAYAANTLGAKAIICARDGEKAAQLAKRFQLQALPWDQRDLPGAILCNATPLGMGQHSELSLAPSLAGVFDAVANPAQTALVEAATAQGLPVVSGDMLSLEQACLQFTLYTAMPAPRQIMQEAMRG